MNNKWIRKKVRCKLCGQVIEGIVECDIPKPKQTKRDKVIDKLSPAFELGIRSVRSAVNLYLRNIISIVKNVI